MTILTEAVKEVESQFGKGVLQRLGSRETIPVETTSTGALTLDLALGIGGVPKGRVVEIFGPESAGKTTLVYHLIANVQAKGGTAAFIDAEHALDPVYAKTVGVDTDNLLVSQPDYGEQALEVADTLVKKGIDIVAVDSVDGITPRSILEGEMGEASVARLAQLMSQALRKLVPAANRTGSTVVFTNQIRMNINTMGFGPKETQPGGRALPYYAAQRLDIRRIETLTDKHGEAYGHRARVKVVKNKLAPPHRKAEFVIRYGQGVSNEDCLFDLGLEYGIIKSSSKGRYEIPGIGKVHGRENAIQELVQGPVASEELLTAIKLAVRV